VCVERLFLRTPNRDLKGRIHGGVEVTELSTNKQLSLSSGVRQKGDLLGLPPVVPDPESICCDAVTVNPSMQSRYET
jgi:hypothetical protein